MDRLTPGELLADRYHVVRALEWGGEEAAYEAEDAQLREKVILRQLQEPRALEQARRACRVKHPNVCQVLDVIESPRHVFLVIEFVDGEDAASLLRRIGRPTKIKALQISRELCTGLEAIHAVGLLHGRLEPGNVMIDGSGRARLTDFGLGSRWDGAPIDPGDATIYVAPEQRIGHPTTRRSDIFGLGQVIRELFVDPSTVEVEGPEEPRTGVQLDLAPDLVAILQACLEEDPGHRPATARAVAEKLAGIDPDARVTPEAEGQGAQLRTLVFIHLAVRSSLEQDLGRRRAEELLHRAERRFLGRMVAHDGLNIEDPEGWLALFERPLQALLFALGVHAELDGLSRQEGQPLMAQVGIHLGEVVVRESSRSDSKTAQLLDSAETSRLVVVQLAALARMGQCLLTGGAFELARRAAVGIEDAEQLRWLDHGSYRLRESTEVMDVFEVGREGQAPLVAPDESSDAQRLLVQRRIVGWRPAPGLSVPQRPGWRLKRKLGVGGFGEVWLARRSASDAPRSFKFCFDQERLQALQREITVFRLLKEELGERIDIHRILDWNFATAPYFIESEYSAAGNLAEWAESEGGLSAVPLEARLEIVSQVATALAAAHSVGVLHKDVKPSNVLIQTHGRAVQAQLADFGIGLVTERERLAAAGITVLGFGEFAVDNSGTGASGTRLYSAPELLEGQRPTRQADLYALGVMLYQLVVGDFSRAMASGWRRDVHDELLAEDIASLVDRSPERRPASALVVADRLRRLEERRDERRVLAEANRAFEASLRRRRLYKALTAAALAVLLSVSSVGLWALWVGRKERLEREATDQTLEYIVEVFEATDPFAVLGVVQSRGATLTMLEILGRETERLATSFKDQPLIRARLMDTFGNIYRSLGRFTSARPLLEQALELRQRFRGKGSEIATSHHHLALLLHDQGDYQAAEAQYRTALAMRQRLFGEEHLDLAVSLHGLASLLRSRGAYDESESLYRESLAMKLRLLGDEHLQVVDTQNNLAILLQAKRGDYEEAERLHRRAQATMRRLLGDEDSRVATSLNNLADLLRTQRRYGEAASLFREALAMYQRVLGEEHPRVANTHNNLGLVLAALKEYDEAETHYQLALAIKRRRLGDEHPSLAISLANLGQLFQAQGLYGAAEPLLREALTLRQHSLGSEHPQTIRSLSAFASVLRQMERYQEAELLYREVLSIQQRLGTHETPSGLTNLVNLAGVMGRLKRLGEAVSLYREGLILRQKLLGAQHVRVANVLTKLAWMLEAQGQVREAEGLAQKALDIYRQGDPPISWRIAEAESILGACWTELGRYAAAEPLIVASYPIVRDEKGPQSVYTRDVLGRLVRLYEAWGRSAQADQYRALWIEAGGRE